MHFYWAIINWNFIWNIDLNNGVYCDLRNKSACLNTVLRSEETLNSYNYFRLHQIWATVGNRLLFNTITKCTYIHNKISHYNPSARIIDLVSHTTYVVCVNFLHEWRHLQFNIDSERQIFEKLFHVNVIYSQSFCQKSAERKWPMKYFFIFSFWCVTCDLNNTPRTRLWRLQICKHF